MTGCPQAQKPIVLPDRDIDYSVLVNVGVSKLDNTFADVLLML